MTSAGKRVLKNITGQSDKQIGDLRTTFVELRQAFLGYATVTTEITVVQIMDNMGMISTQLNGMTDELKQMSSRVSDLGTQPSLSEAHRSDNWLPDLKELPYKSGWRSDIQRHYLEGTRTKFLQHVVEWVENPNSKRGLVLFGLAGTGKSSIAREIAERYERVGRLSSYFIFLRAERSKSEDYLLFATLIRDLSNRYPAFKTALGNVIEKDKSLPATRDYRILFKPLILEPLRDEVRIVCPVLIIIDALDESGDASKENGLHTFLPDCLAKLPSNFRILITSRQNAEIEHPFINETEAFEIKYMDDSELATAMVDDIRLYFQKNLPREKFTQYGDKLVTRAEGLFQWAAVARGYICRPPPGLTEDDCILALLDHHKELGQKLSPLNDLYKQVLETYFDDDLVKIRFRSVVGQLLAAFEPLSIKSLTALQRYSLHDRDIDDSVMTIVKPLGSLLSNVTSTDQTLPVVLHFATS